MAQPRDEALLLPEVGLYHRKSNIGDITNSDGIYPLTDRQQAQRLYDNFAGDLLEGTIRGFMCFDVSDWSAVNDRGGTRELGAGNVREDGTRHATPEAAALRRAGRSVVPSEWAVRGTRWSPGQRTAVTLSTPVMQDRTERVVTVRESVYIEATVERVWDYTQDWSRRTEWDPAILAAEVLPGDARVVRARTHGGIFDLRYKLVDRPRRTSLAMLATRSRWFAAGGGSWDYAPEGRGTRFTQQNTLVLRENVFAPFLAKIVRWTLARATRRALANARRVLEFAPN